MKKMALSVTAFSIITAGLAGCGTADDNAAGPNGGNTGMNQVDNQQQAAWDNERGDRGEGPITDMFTVDDRTDRGNQVNQQGQGDGTRNLNDGQGSFYYNNPRDVADGNMYTDQERDANFQRGDRYETGNAGNNGNAGMQNDHGQLNANNQNDDNEAQELASKIEEEVNDMDNVDNSHVVVDDQHVVVGIQTNGDDTDDTIQHIEQEIEDEMDADKEVFVTDDEDNFEELGNIQNDLAEGTGNALEETEQTLTDMIEDLGDAAQRPFERSR
ncbi:hypothetical protein HNR44_001466 [Geomicrobium halophilum]|uniref:Sporulation lipoprotein YhcN/YlaJ (Spore_YhcN_YlaJ) n=1 Tax=Geomicrobium halophilum TaxID=549000 RepID=A0A841PKX8_9BACL|nr:YhcN/YlaJ family sporulation lipoprotein [Geomicrobium halophilum]MBB6449517.1 hypothetical protein [Geomicrobium halophilum]